jgi:hypothetical protein
MATPKLPKSLRGAWGRRRPRVVLLGFLLFVLLLLFSQYSVMRVSVKKYLRNLDKAKAFVKIAGGDEDKLGRLPFDSYGDEGRPDFVVSRGTVMGTTSGSGNMVKQFYRVENVRLGKEGLDFYYEDGFRKPGGDEDETSWVDTIFNNGTSMRLPTVTMMRHAENGKYTYIKWHYNPASKKQPACRKWVRVDLDRRTLARHDSLTRATRYALRSFARSTDRRTSCRCSIAATFGTRGTRESRQRTKLSGSRASCPWSRWTVGGTGPSTSTTSTRTALGRLNRRRSSHGVLRPVESRPGSSRRDRARSRGACPASTVATGTTGRS